MEEKLAIYRKNKEKEEPRSNIRKDITSIVKTTDEADDRNDGSNLETCAPSFLFNLYNIKYLLQALLWICLLMFFVTIEFGMVFMVVSGLFIMFYSMKVRSKKSEELSAYSVFNENMERIDGTFTAEQFEKQMIYGKQGIF